MSRNPYAEHQPTGGAGSFVKFEDGKTLKVRIVSDPVIFDSIFEAPGVPRTVSTKYAFLIYNVEDSEVQIMQLPKTGFRALAAVAADEDYGNPMENNYMLKITRTGQKQQTKYSIVPFAKAVELDEETQAEIDDIDLVDRISKSPNSDRVAWLYDEIDGKRPKESTIDTVVEDIDEDDTVNLDDLPL